MSNLSRTAQEIMALAVVDAELGHSVAESARRLAALANELGANVEHLRAAAALLSSNTVATRPPAGSSVDVSISSAHQLSRRMAAREAIEAVIDAREATL